MQDGATQRLLDEAERLIDAGAYETALSLCRQAAASDARLEHLVLIADICIRSGAASRALEFLDAAEKRRPVDARAALIRAEALETLKQLGEACDCAERALALGATGARAWSILGRILLAGGRQGAAEACLSAAVKSVSRDAGARLQLAICYHVGGALDAAKREYREALSLEPDLAMAWFGLSQLGKGSLTAEDTVRVHALAERATDAETQLIYAHVKARILEDSGEYLSAFEALKSAKTARRTMLNYSFARDEALFDAAGEAHKPHGEGVRGVAPIFVVGMPRTGTTLIERILSAHPQVSSAGETDEFWVALKRLVRTPSPLALDAPTLRAASQANAYDLGRAYLDRIRLRAPPAARLVDKMPLNFIYAPQILSALPDARIVCVRRDAADTCVANYMQFFTSDPYYFGYVYDIADVARFYRRFDHLVAYWRASLPADRFAEFRYEDMVTSQERETRRLLEFCGLEWEEQCLAFHENAGQIRTASASQARQPLYASSVGRWRRYAPVLADMLEVLERPL